MTNPLVERYLDEAIRFTPARSRGGDGKPLRVAANLVTCSLAAEVLNELQVPEESETAYHHVNIHNPRCPLAFDRDTQRWACTRGLEEHPVWGLNWSGAVLVCEHLGGRLPLAAEWECLASNNEPARVYPWGDAEPTHLLANYDEYYGGPTPVGSFAPTEIGLYDVAGNLGEWCRDRMVASDGQPGLERMVKGGAWSKDAYFLKIAVGRGKWARLGTTTIGVRPVWDDT
jgi:formylglycine-generating enzyme required for sulfatase activity